ncbi:MAG: hypothetical protein EPO26_14115 [Chloroflexota bacterium]|nr:MAG: hypothetical protein EPO26_14115 [Chloroflexota bacterium]
MSSTPPLNPDDVRLIVENTRIVRPPKQLLATFGTTILHYYVVTEPSYVGLPGAGTEEESVIRTGTVTSARPQLVTPSYLMNLFQGFEHGQEFARYLRSTYGADAPGLMYSYKQEPTDTNVVSDRPDIVAARIAEEMDRDGKSLAVVIRGVDQFWDISLAHFIHALTIGSVPTHAADFAKRGLLAQEGGMPRAAREKIDTMFRAVQAGEIEASDLKTEIDRWGLFGEYEDRFLNLFRKRA